ncbi:uncharacterized protein LOC123292033 [Chrysoperla carnea]|uniref:uncharacterized protein LOC123292033 n=1 Tax=Chrysoperla carnea TaxID=189513 RepID=UPI001D09684B|nr:uncharacterized protein LOC123292033 [Chrysoperla carnea]
MNTITEEIYIPDGTAKKAIHEIIDEEQFQEYQIQIDNGSKNGDNYLGYIYRVYVLGTDKNRNTKELNLILKCSPRMGVLPTITPVNEIFQREILMYNEFLPLLFKIQDQWHFGNGFNQTAKLYKASAVKNDEYLVMENVKLNGYQLQNRQLPLDYRHCKIFLKQLAYYHGLTLILKHDNEQLFKYYANLVTDKHIMKVSDFDMIKEQNVMMVEKALKTLDPQSVAYKRYKEYAEISFDRITEFSKTDINDEISVITHGDCWINNMLFQYDKNGSPSNVLLIDWQASRWGSPVYDLAYFFYNCTDQNLRSKHFTELLDYYHECVQYIISQCSKHNPDFVFPKSKFYEHVQKYFCLGISMCIYTLNIFLTNSENIPNVREINEINLEEMERWNNATNMGQSGYEKRMRDVITDAVERNFI